jgi:uncharacterized protein (DUF1015 family)
MVSLYSVKSNPRTLLVTNLDKQMKLIKPFRGLRPTRELAAKVASHPYDVINREEAKLIAEGNPFSFLLINKPEIDMPDNVDLHDQLVYDKGAENLKRFVAEGTLVQDSEEKLYVYKQVMGEHEQVGLVAVASVEAYEKDLIKKHEYTRPVKEDDRVAHMDTLNAQVGPVFLTYRSESGIDQLIARVTKTTPEYDFQADDGTRHTFWVIEDIGVSADIESAFGSVDCLYVADGHHRSAAAQRVKNMRERQNPNHSGDEAYNYFLVVLFPHDQMQILDYNRIIEDIGEQSEAQFLAKLEEHFHVLAVDEAAAAKPSTAKQLGLYMAKQWYHLAPKESLLASIDDSDPVNSLDVSLLQNTILTPLLGITDQRRDKRIDFVGGIRGLAELEKRVDSGQWQLALALYPTSIESLMAIADAGEVMPPKSTWFEPKLKSGLVVHCLDD